MPRGARGGKVNIRLSSKAGGELQPRARKEGGRAGGRRDDFQIYCGKLKECWRPRAYPRSPVCMCMCVFVRARACATFQPSLFPCILRSRACVSEREREIEREKEKDTERREKKRERERKKGRDGGRDRG